MSPEEKNELRQRVNKELLELFNQGRITVFCDHCHCELVPEIIQDFITCIHCGGCAAHQDGGITRCLTIQDAVPD